MSLRTHIQKLKKRIKAVFSQGLSKKEILMAAILGGVIGILPAFGISTILATFSAVKLRLNVGVTLVFNYLFSVFQPLLFLSFIHLGEAIFGVKHTLLTYKDIKNALLVDYLDTIKDLWLEFLCGISGWLVFSLPIFGLLYFFSPKRIYYEK